GTIKFDALQALVLDEADEMLRMGFIDDVESIMEKTPREKQTCLFSATMPKQIQNISSKYMNNPEQVHISARNSTVSSVEQVFWNASIHKNKAIVRFLEAEQYEGAIVFVRTRNDTVQLAELLEREGFSAAPLNGDMNQQARERTVERLKSGMLNVVIATDVAARGLDVDRLSLVINYDIPQDSEAYVHRIGRTGRAGRTGKAILFVKHNERYLLKNIIRHTNSDIAQVELPTAKIVEEKRIEALQAKLTLALENKDITFFNEVAANMAQKLELSAEDLAGALLCLAQQQSPIKVEEVKIQPRERNERNDRNPRSNDRGDRGRRNERGGERGGERAERKPRERNSRDAGPMDTYRIEVGREHGVQVKNIVGAIANEADISSKFIGDIRLHDNHSTVQLPKNMPKDVLDHFQKVFICKRPMGLTITADQGPAEPRGERSERPSGDKKRSFNKDDSARGDKRSGPRKERRPVSFTTPK
uniref:helicase-related protein n=1 Tax=Pseudoalteromonas nigrifaciens TaxID=28109 RepID=UPI003564D7F8